MNDIQLTINITDHALNAVRYESDFSAAISGLKRQEFNFGDLITAILSGAKLVYHAFKTGESLFELLERVWNAIVGPQPIKVEQQIPAKIYFGQYPKELVPRCSVTSFGN